MTFSLFLQHTAFWIGLGTLAGALLHKHLQGLALGLFLGGLHAALWTTSWLQPWNQAMAYPQGFLVFAFFIPALTQMLLVDIWGFFPKWAKHCENVRTHSMRTRKTTQDNKKPQKKSDDDTDDTTFPYGKNAP